MLALIHAMPMERRTACLDFGCGSGYGTELLGTYFPETIGVDTDEKSLLYARTMHSRSGATFQAAIPSARRFDFIACIEVIEHLEKDEAAKLIGEFARMLSPEGRLVLTTPIATTLVPENHHHKHEYAVEEFDAFLKEHFREVFVTDISIGMPNMLAVCLEPKL